MKIVCFGDSITKGQVSYNWVSQLRRLFPQNTIVKMGVNGELAFNALQRVDAVLKENPDVVFVLLGSNDLFSIASERNTKIYLKNNNLPQLPNKAWYVENMEKIIVLLQQYSNAKVVLITIPIMGEVIADRHNLLLTEYNAELKQLASIYHCDVLDLQLALKEFLIIHPPKKPVSLELNLTLLFKAMFLHYVFFLSWNFISKINGLVLSPDTLHLNERSGKILLSLIENWLLKWKKS